MSKKHKSSYEESNPGSAHAHESAAEIAAVDVTNTHESQTITVKNLKNGIGAGIYHAAFGLSYGLVFSAVFVTELLPETNVLRRGFADGAYAAIDAVADRNIRALSDNTEDQELVPPEHASALAH